MSASSSSTGTGMLSGYVKTIKSWSTATQIGVAVGAVVVLAGIGVGLYYLINWLVHRNDNTNSGGNGSTMLATDGAHMLAISPILFPGFPANELFTIIESTKKSPTSITAQYTSMNKYSPATYYLILKEQTAPATSTLQIVKSLPTTAAPTGTYYITLALDSAAGGVQTMTVSTTTDPSPSCFLSPIFGISPITGLSLGSQSNAQTIMFRDMNAPVLTDGSSTPISWDSSSSTVTFVCPFVKPKGDY